MWGLLALVLVLAYAVQTLTPRAKAPIDMQGLLLAHEGGLYFFDAENMAKQIFSPDPSLRWSQCVLDADTTCFLAGNGVWYAKGTLSGSPDKLPTPPNWEELFVPGEARPLYVRLGNRASGDPQAALQRAGRTE